MFEEYERNGYPRFEILPLRKSPPPKGWQQLSSVHRPIPKGWNCGIDTKKFAVVDIDRHELIQRFIDKFNELITTVIETPRGGRHFYFSGYTRNQQNDGWDTRGDGGYAMAAGSRTRKGVYRVLSEIVPISELKPFPEILQPKKKEVIIERVNEEDPLLLIHRARTWLAKVEPAVMGADGSDKMFYACCWLFSKFGLTPDQAVGLILEYNARCVPPFSLKEIQHKIEDAHAKNSSR